MVTSIETDSTTASVHVARRPAGGSAVGVTTAVLLATAPADGGGPAATLPWEHGTVLGRLLEQLSDLGLTSFSVVTRPAWRDDVAAAIGSRTAAAVHDAPDLAGDLQAVAGIVERADGGVLVIHGDIVTHREALAGLLADPRVATGVLAGARRRSLAFRMRTARGRVVSAASPYHAAQRPNATFLGVLKVSSADRGALAHGARRLAELLADGPSRAWEQELQRKVEGWRLRSEEGRRLAEDAAADDALIPDGRMPDSEPGDEATLATDEAEIARRMAVVREDAVSLLVVALVRSDTHLTAGYLRSLFWARPVSREAVAQAAENLAGYDEDRVLLESAVKARDGFFTTFFVSPYSKYLARWAARRGWTPNWVTTLSVVIGFLAAAAFATGERWGLIAGAVLLQIAFTTDCVDGQLARYTRQFSKLGAWLDSIFDRTKEYAVFAGLAIGASAAGDDVWPLAAAALILQTARHLLDFSFAAGQHQAIAAITHPPLEEPWEVAGGRPPVETPAAPATPARPETAPRPADEPRGSMPGRALRAWRRFDRLPGLPWVKRMIAFPIGERFAAISLTAALTTPRTTFVVLLVWGGVAAAYTFGGRLLRSLLPSAKAALSAARGTGRNTLAVYRDDGLPAVALGRAVGRALPLGGAVLAALGAAPLLIAVAFAGADASDGLAAAVVAWFVVLAGASSGRPDASRLRWTAPAVIRVTEYTAIVWLSALAGPRSVPAAFAFLCALAFRHYDLVYRLRHRALTPPAWVNHVALGWDGRVLLCLVLLLAGGLPTGLYVAAGLLAVLIGGECVAGWARFTREHRARPVGSYDEEEDEGQ